MNISGELAKLLNSNENKGTKPYDTKATVKRVENGVAWVHIPGGVDETPAQLTINAKPGDSVQVRVADGKAFLVGNGSAPPTDDTTARQAIDFSKIASDAANAAVQDASTARTAAASAQAAADHAEEVAEGVEAIAESAKTAADTAFTNLSQVQSVLEVAQWIATHGTYVKATVFNPNATYYMITATQVTEPSDDDKDSQGVLIYYELDNGIYVRTTDTSVDDQKTYYRVTGTPVAQPDAEHIADYYTLAVSEAMADYVQSHLALTNDGLWIIPDQQSGNRVLIATGQGEVYTEAGTYIIGNGVDSDLILAMFTEDSVRIGSYGTGYLSLSSDSIVATTPEGLEYYRVGLMGQKSVNTRLSEWFKKTYFTADFSSEKYAKAYGYLPIGDSFRVIVEVNYSYKRQSTSNWTTGRYSKALDFIKNQSQSWSDDVMTIRYNHYSNKDTVYSSASMSALRTKYNWYDVKFSSTEFIVTFTAVMPVPAYSFGVDCVSEKPLGFALGEGTISSDTGLACGKYNVEDSNDEYVFIAGNGASGNRSNAFAIKWNGDAELALDTTAQSGDDHDIYTALQTLGWDNDVIV